MIKGFRATENDIKRHKRHKGGEIYILCPATESFVPLLKRAKNYSKDVSCQTCYFETECELKKEVPKIKKYQGVPLWEQKNSIQIPIQILLGIVDETINRAKNPREYDIDEEDMEAPFHYAVDELESLLEKSDHVNYVKEK